jgi:Ca2+/H+ antiporter
MVVIGWIGLGQPADMTLNFDGFQIAVLFISIILVNYLIQVIPSSISGTSVNLLTFL